MMNVSALTGQGAAAVERQADQAKADLDYDSFLKLLVASMQNQDPTKPNDPSETLSQLASFSSVEQAIKSNAKLDQILAVSATSQAAMLIGKSVERLDGSAEGEVAAVEVSNGQLVAILDGGERVAIDTGIRITG